MKYLGVDYGEKRVGIAVSDAAGSIAFPRETLANERLVAQLVECAAREGADAFVVGDTRASGGRENAVTAQVDDLMRELAQASGKPVHAASELHSSIEASRYAPEGKTHDDAAAAAVILQRFLDMHRQRAERSEQNAVEE